MKPSIASLQAGEYGSYSEEATMLIDEEWFHLDIQSVELSIAGYKHISARSINKKEKKKNKPIPTYTPFNPDRDYIDFICRQLGIEETHEPFVFPKIVKSYFVPRYKAKPIVKAPKPMKELTLTPEFIISMLQDRWKRKMSISSMEKSYQIRSKRAEKLERPYAVPGKDFSFGFETKPINDYGSKVTLLYLITNRSGVFNTIKKFYFKDIFYLDKCFSDIEKEFDICINRKYNSLYLEEVKGNIAELCLRPICLTYDIPDYYIKIGVKYINGKMIPVLGLCNRQTYRFVEDINGVHQHSPYRRLYFINTESVRLAINEYLGYYNLGPCNQSLIELVFDWWGEIHKIIKEYFPWGL